MRKAYFGEPNIQTHFREMGEGRTLFLLPPSPHSGSYFETIMPILARSFHVIAPDYPGFGGSDVSASEPSIEDYAERLIPLIEAFGLSSLVGFHTGNLVGLEIGLKRPDLVEQLVMIDVPFFDAETRAVLDLKMGQAAVYPHKVDDLSKSFETNVTNRVMELGQKRAYDIWVESLRAGKWQGSAFHAAFTYDCEARFLAYKREIIVIATQSGLLGPTRQGAELLCGVKLIERLDIEGAVFEKFASEMAAQICDVLK